MRTMILILTAAAAVTAAGCSNMGGSGSASGSVPSATASDNKTH